MPASYKLKVVAIGGRNSGKSCFFENFVDKYNTFYDRSYNSVGVSIKIKCFSREEAIDLNNITLAIWSINPEERFKFLYSTFFRGATGGLLFFNMANENCLNNLIHWIGIVRNLTEYIPIILVGYESDLYNKVSIDEIREFVEEHEIEEFFLFSKKSDNKSLILNHLARNVLENIGSESAIIKLKSKLSTEERELYEDFMSFFCSCPICHKKNHQSYLNRFYFSKNQKVSNLKDMVLKLMKKSSKLGKNKFKMINVGIPCCECFSKIFQEH